MTEKNKRIKKNKENTKIYKTKPVEKEKVEKNDTEKRKEKKKKSKLRKIVKILFILFVVGMIVGGGIFAGVLYGAFGDELKITREQLLIKSSNSVVLDKDGNIIANLSGDENRKIITLQDMSPYLPVAFISIEDERFYEHKGVDVKRTVHAILEYVLHFGKSDFGGSTITQQLVKMITLESERAWQRKVKEISRAYEVERLISKDQVLELYLNMIFLGDTVYGVEVGSTYYFNKTAKDLTIAECAFLAGINHSPNAYDVFDSSLTPEQLEARKEKVKVRTKTVLTKMKELGKINEEEYNKAIEEVNNGLAFNNGQVTQVVHSYHTDAAINQIIEQLQEENVWGRELAKKQLYEGNYTIYTTQDSKIQARAQEEAEKDRYIIKSKLNEGKTSEIAFTIIDQKTGYVVATIGGTGPKTVAFGLNRSTQQPKATGSSMKPLAVIVPGIETGIITAGKAYDDIPTKWGSWSPKNSGGGYKGLMTVRDAIGVSENIPHIKMLADIGVDTSYEFLQKLGISSLTEKDKGLALALGGLTNGITTVEMAAAYATIANNGVYITPTFYTKVVDKGGNTILEPKQETRRVISEASAYVVKNILTQPVISGTATMCRIPGMDVSAKTGTTDDDYDRWLCGFTNYYTGACWFGYDKNETVRFQYSSNPAASIWAAVMKDIHEPLENSKFQKPSGITYATICKDSGLLAGEACRNDPRGNRVYTEVYVAGTAPNKMCDCHTSVKICNDTGKIANEYCTNTADKVFITRTNSDINTSWRVAKDSEYMLPTEICDIHKAPVLTPTPTPSISPSPTPTPSTLPSPTPTPSISPSPTPTPTP